MIDNIAEKISQWFGSTPFLILHVVWFSAWFIFKLDPQLLTLIVSLEAIFLTILILRAEIVQSSRLEKYIKQAAKVSKQDLQLSEEVLKLIKKKGT